MFLDVYFFNKHNQNFFDSVFTRILRQIVLMLKELLWLYSIVNYNRNKQNITFIVRKVNCWDHAPVLINLDLCMEIYKTRKLRKGLTEFFLFYSVAPPPPSQNANLKRENDR